MPEFPFAVPDRLLSIADLLAEQGWAVAESGLAPEVLAGGVHERQYPPRGDAGPPSPGQSGRLVPPASGQPAAALTGGSAPALQQAAPSL